MEAYANALLYAIPGFLILIIIEILYGHFTKNQTYTFMDTLASLSSGVTNIIKDSLGLAIVLISYPFFLKYLAITEVPGTLWTYLIAFICIDFASYWSHRLNHKVNVFWNQHIIHHSSEEFNLACALRQSISNIISFNAIFLIPAAILGVPPQIINVLAPLHLFGQFWYHTKHIGKLGILEYILVTPSQHRVHHAINPIYIDKNLAAIFCVWDRMFGTFQEELETEPPVYGTLKPVRTWNPVWINFLHFWGLLRDAWYTQKGIDKIRLWFMPTGWRPLDVQEKFPVKTVENVQNQTKYNPPTPIQTQYWALCQMLLNTVLLLTFLAGFGALTTNQKWIVGIFLLLHTFGYTSILDGHRWARIFVALIGLFGIGITRFTPIGEALAVTTPPVHTVLFVFSVASLLSVYLFVKPNTTKKAIEKVIEKV